MVNKLLIIGGGIGGVVVIVIIILVIISVTAPWNKVKKRMEGESNSDWSTRIYQAMINNPNLATNPGTNPHVQFLGSKPKLDKDTATKLCGNPCHWSGAEGSPLCKCDGSTPTGVKGWGLF